MATTTTRKINFKHVGIKRSNRKFRIDIEQPAIPVGIKTPMQLGSGKSGLFDMHFQPSEQIQDNLKNLILTNNGERLGDYNYGANLKSLTFDLADINNFEQFASDNIRNAIELYMPFVELSNVSIGMTDHQYNQTLPNGIAQVIVTLTYNVPKIKVIGRKLQAVIYAGG